MWLTWATHAELDPCRLTAHNVYTLIHNPQNLGSIMETTKVGIREFRADLAEYIASSSPVAVTRHGHTVGYFIPTPGQAEADLAALTAASKTLDQWLQAQGVDVEGVVAEFKAARKKTGPSKKLKAKMA
jgi:hypothetical protein